MLRSATVYIDESGDTGFDFDNGSSQYFLIGFAYFPYDNCSICMQMTRQVIKYTYGKVYKELKAADCNNTTRSLVLMQLAKHNVRCGYFYVDKQKKQIQEHFEDDENIFLAYKELICSQLEHLILNEKINDLSVHIDHLSQLKGGETQTKRLKRHLFRHRPSVEYVSSKTSDGVQCADFTCWSAKKALEREPYFYNIIKNRVIFIDKFKLEE